MPIGAGRLALLRRRNAVAPQPASIVLTAPDAVVLNSNFLSGVPTSEMALTAPSPTFAAQPLLPQSLTIALTAPDPTPQNATTTWPNGFVAYREIVVPAHAHGGTLSRLIMLLDETLQSFRHANSGGRLQDFSAFDVRYTLPDLTQLDHEHASHNSTTGLLRSWIAVDTVAGSRTIIRIYYGKPGLVVSEEDSEALWGNAKMALDCVTGADRSAAGFDMTPVNVTSGLLIGAAGIFAGNSVATRADVSTLAGMTDFTLQALIRADAETIGTNRGIFNLNTPSQAVGPSSLSLFYLGSSGAGTNMVQAKCKTASGNAFVISTSFKQSTDEQFLHAVFQAGQRPRIYVNGVEVAGTSFSIQNGAMTPVSGGAYLGAGAFDLPTGGWEGAIDELRLWPAASSAVRVAAEALSALQPRRFYGLGGENLAGDTVLAPVAPPMEAAGITDTAADIDVAANGYDPAGGALAITGAPSTTLGTVSVVLGKLRCTSAISGLAQVSYQLANAGGKVAPGRVYLRWTQAEEPAGGRPKHPPPAVNTLRVPSQYATIALAYAAAGAGDHIEVASGTYASTLTFDRNIDPNNPVVIRSATTHGAVLSGRVFANNATGIWFYELRFTYQGFPETNVALHVGSQAKVTRCWFQSRCGIVCGSFLNPSDDGSTYIPRHHVWIGWNRFNGQGNASETNHIKIYKNDNVPNGADPNEFSDIYIYRNFFNDGGPAPASGDTTYHIYLGNTKVSDGIYPGQPTLNNIPRFSNFYIEENYSSPNSSRQRLVYIKSGVTRAARNFAARLNGFPFSQRTGRGTQWWGNRSHSSATWPMGGGGTQALFTDMRRNVGGTFELHSGSANNAGAAEHFAADYYLLYGNAGTLLVGQHVGNFQESRGGKVNDARIYTHTGTILPFDATYVDTASITVSPGNPLNLANPPAVTGITDSFGTVLSTFGPLNVGMETADQD